MTADFSLPPNCVLRPARKSDRWALQQLVFTLIWSEALGFDLRIVAYRLVKLSVLVGLLALELWSLQTITAPALQSVVLALIVFTGLWAIATAIVIVLYVLFIPTEPLFNWSMYWVVAEKDRPVACAALSDFGEFCVLYHVVVAKPWRGRSLASCLVHQLMEQAKHPVYLVCKPHLTNLYSRLGLVSIGWKQLPNSVRMHFKDFEIDCRISHVQWKIMSSSQGDALLHLPQ